MLTFALALAVAAGPPRAPKAPPPVSAAPGKGYRPNGTAVDSVEVLAISLKSGWAAMKVVSHQEPQGSGAPDDVESIDCGYPGMKQHPTSGVTLLTWSLTRQAVDKTFVVYALATDKAQCSSAADNKAHLDAAKAEIAARGLDLARKPVSSFEGITSRDDSTSTEEEGAIGSTVNAVTTFSAAGRVFYELKHQYDTAYAGRASFEAAGAYVEDGKVVFFQKYRHTTMRSAESEYSFSPVLVLPK